MIRTTALTLILCTTSCLAAPQVRIGNTTVVGTTDAANTEFFGGKKIHQAKFKARLTNI
jgi:hypothetical protein